MRLFSKVSYEVHNERVVKPSRKTAFSAGYDFTSPLSVTIDPGGIAHIPTGIKCYMPDCEYLQLAVRSGLARKGLMLTQGVGIIDADYVDNTDNEGNIAFTLINMGLNIIHIECGDRIGQGIFLEYKLTADDANDAKEVRKGGFGSTGS